MTSAPIQSEFSPDNPVASVPSDQDLTACLEIAAWIGRDSSDDYLHSFTTIFIALLHADNSLSKWFLRYARAAEVKLEAIYATRQFRPAQVAAIREHRARNEIPSGKPAWTRSATDIIENAQRLMGRTSSTTLGVRHVLGAYLFALPPGHEEQVVEWGFDKQLAASAFVRQMSRQHPSELTQWTETHKDTFDTEPDLLGSDPLPPPRISKFDADTPEGDDQLNIEDDVYALSALICSTHVIPPLSIGLFGEWGSGKSFFIRQLRNGVSWISAQARASEKMQNAIPFYKHVVQIEFNAWNYAGGNLWAALVQHILENLRLTEAEGQNLVEVRREYLQQQMKLERVVREAEQVKEQAAQVKLDAASEELERLRKQHEQEITNLKEARAKDVLQEVKIDSTQVDEINDLRQQLGLPAVTSSAGDFLAALESTRNVLRRGTAVFEFVPPDQRKRFLYRSAVAMFIPPVAALLLGAILLPLHSTIAAIASVMGWLSATLTIATAWVRGRVTQINAQISQVEKLQAHARQQVEAKEQEHRAEEAQFEQRIALAKDEVLVAQTRKQEAASHLEQIQAQLAATTPASVLADFVRDRSQSEDYRKYLGLPAVISRDFKAISDMITQENKNLGDMTCLVQENAHSDRRINRIVLYIDDLDRCPEDQVVAVLQAVHLLLAFPLFVVVVAVDARWISRSLVQRFPGLLVADNGKAPSIADATHIGTASPDDYLEKIFQIPFWVQPPSEDGVKQMLRTLMKEGESGGDTPVSQGGNEAPTRSPEQDTPTGVFKHHTHDPDARALNIESDEQDYIQRLASLLGRTPRAVKRFMNVYRLMKASLSPEEQDSFLDANGPLGAPYKIVLMLLAIQNGMPMCFDALRQALLAAPQTKPAGGPDAKADPGNTPNANLGAIIDKIPKGGETANAEMSRVTAWLNNEFKDQWRTADPADLRTWVERVARYSYQLHRGAGS